MAKEFLYRSGRWTIYRCWRMIIYRSWWRHEYWGDFRGQISGDIHDKFCQGERRRFPSPCPEASSGLFVTPFLPINPFCSFILGQPDDQATRHPFAASGLESGSSRREWALEQARRRRESPDNNGPLDDRPLPKLEFGPTLRPRNITMACSL